MSTTIAKQPSRLEALERRCEELEESQGLLSQKLVELADEEEKVRYEEIQKAPLQSPESATGRVGRIRRKRSKVESDLAACQRNLNTARQVLAAERNKVTEELLAGISREAKQWDKREVEIWRKGGELFHQLHAVYRELRDTIDDRAAEFSARAADFADTGLQEQARALAAPYVYPPPKEWLQFLAKLDDASFDARCRPSLNEWEQDGKVMHDPLRPRTLRHLDDHDRLVGIIPLFENEGS